MQRQFTRRTVLWDLLAGEAVDPEGYDPLTQEALASVEGLPSTPEEWFAACPVEAKIREAGRLPNGLHELPTPDLTIGKDQP